MTNDQLAGWLRDRGVSEEAIKGVVQMADEVKEIYRESTLIGAAMNHEDWIEEITSTGERSSKLDQVVWFLLGLGGGPIAFIEMSK